LPALQFVEQLIGAAVALVEAGSLHRFQRENLGHKRLKARFVAEGVINLIDV
jgi:hypothetical protein